MLKKSKEEMLKLRQEKGETVIPKGYYCYFTMEPYTNSDGNLALKTETCPYLDFDDEKDSQECGYCWFHEEGDWEINETKQITNNKTGEVQTGHDMGIPIGLLWDMCKECGINMYNDEEDEHLFRMTISKSGKFKTGDIVEWSGGRICNGKYGVIAIGPYGELCVLDNEGAPDMALEGNEDDLTVVGNEMENPELLDIFVNND